MNKEEALQRIKELEQYIKAMDKKRVFPRVKIRNNNIDIRGNETTLSSNVTKLGKSIEFFYDESYAVYIYGENLNPDYDVVKVEDLKEGDVIFFGEEGEEDYVACYGVLIGFDGEGDALVQYITTGYDKEVLGEYALSGCEEVVRFKIK